MPEGFILHAFEFLERILLPCLCLCLCGCVISYLICLRYVVQELQLIDSDCILNLLVYLDFPRYGEYCEQRL